MTGSTDPARDPHPDPVERFAEAWWDARPDRRASAATPQPALDWTRPLVIRAERV